MAHQYDALGQLIKTLDALGNTIAIAYDQAGRKVSVNDPDTGLWTYNYNALGELVWQQSAKQRLSTPATVTTMAYDLLGRMTGRTEPEYTSTWTYDTVNGASCNAVAGKTSTPPAAL